MTLANTTAPYVVITPAHNEEAYLETTAQSMVAQTVRPMRWIIVNDASTDNTQAIAEKYAKTYEFIQVVNVARSGERHFGNKVRAFNRGLTEAEGLNYDFVGNLDADIAIPPEYFETLLERFDEDANLGIGGGMVHSSIAGQFVSQNVALDSVAGAVQLFRRRCFDAIGGYLQLPLGGIDAAAEIMARMKGWSVQTFPDLRVLEYRRTGTASATPLRSKFRDGQRLYSLGYGLLFMLLRSLYRLTSPPPVIGSAATLLGYFLAAANRNPIVLPQDVVAYLRSEQSRKLRALLRSSLCKMITGR